MQPLGLFTSQPIIGNQTPINKTAANNGFPNANTNFLNTSSPDTVFLLGAMAGLLGQAPSSNLQNLSNTYPLLGFNTVGSNPFATQQNPSLNLAEFLSSLPTQFWNTFLSLLMNSQAATSNSQPVSLKADPSTAQPVIAETTPVSTTAATSPPPATSGQPTTKKAPSSKPKTTKEPKEEEKVEILGRTVPMSTIKSLARNVNPASQPLFQKI